MANPAAKLIERAVALKAANTSVPAREILDELILAHKGEPLVFVHQSPSSPFGQMVAEAFDFRMEPGDWVGLTGPRADPQVQLTLLRIWRYESWPKFLRHYGLA